jgi:glutamate racemase
MNCAPIGIFDSGIGGISVLNRLKTKFAGEDYLYLFDKSGMPYGNKSAAQVIERAYNAAKYLEDRGAKIIIAACNTVSTVALDTLYQWMRVPVIGVFPPIRKAYNKGFRKILVLTTPLTAKSEFVVRTAKDLGSAVILAPQSELAQKVEYYNGCDAFFDAYYRENLAAYEGRVECVALGCTHYYYLSKCIERRMQVPVFDYLDEVESETKAALEKVGRSNIIIGSTRYCVK